MNGRIFKVVVALLLGLVGQLAQAGTVTYVYTDPQGTPLAEADASGNITATFDYKPYGSQVLGTPKAAPGYTGHVNDPDTGFVYMQARYYDEAAGRFIGIDQVTPELGNISNFNRFAYANNNPVVFTDPTGKKTGAPFISSADCEVYRCESFVSDERSADGGSSTGKNNHIPLGTPKGMERYFVGTSTSDRIKAALAVANYYDINMSEVDLIYRPSLYDRADTIRNQVYIGPKLFNQSFGMIGAILSHEIEGHYYLQWRPVLPHSLPGDGQSLAFREVQAFDLELRPSNIKRFGLAPEEIEEQRGWRDRYYNQLTPGNRGMVDRGVYHGL
jgi:RHS repeat-associated protein